ncbi:MAG: hypothetical protein AAFU79_34970, partial [Myxococcota bacterium]
SDFLETLYEPPLPDDIEYHLLFAYEETGGSDGTVPITRQLHDPAQEQADVVRGYVATHVGILENEAAAAQVYAALERCRDGSGPRVAPRITTAP